MTDIATRVASLLDDRLLDLHKALDAGDPQNPADVEAHHLVAVEMLRRGHQHGHTEDPWATAAIVTDEVQVDGPDDIEAPEGLSVAWEGALSKGGTVSIVLTTDGYVLKAQPSVNEVHHVEEPEGTDPGEPVEKSWDDADVLTALTSEDRAWFATVATVLDSGGDPDLLVAKGNPEPLRDYWRKGGNGKVNWGAGGDFTSCAAAVSKYMTSEEAKGYCAIRHRETTGMWPGDKRNRAQKAAADMTGILTLPDGSTYTFSPEPVAKHGSPGRPGYSQLHGGGSGGGAPRATAVDIKSGTASSNALPKAAQKRLRQELNRGTLVDTYGSSFERGREHKTGRDRHGEPITTSGGGDPVRHHREQRDSALATLDAMPLRSGASDSWAAKVATHQGFIDGATGARPMFPRSHTFGETLSGILFGGLSGATKAADLVEQVEKHGDPSRPGYAQMHGTGSGSRKPSGKRPALNEPDNPPGETDKRRPDSIAAARAERARVAAIEPEITADMVDIADAHGGKLEGLDFRLKSEKSLARKIDAERDEPKFGGDPEKCARDMSDVARYTITFGDSQYVAGSKAVIKDLEAQGYELRVKNYWHKGDPYQGINIAATHPKTGVTFEIQLHTPTSLDFKEPKLSAGDPMRSQSTHVLYETYRESKNNRVRYDTYHSMRRQAQQIPVPPPPSDLLAIGEPRFQYLITTNGSQVMLP